MGKRVLFVIAVVLAALVPGGAASAGDMSVEPSKAPPGAPVRLLMTCAGDPVSVAVQLRPSSEPAPSAYDPSRNLFPPVAHRSGDQPGFFLVELTLDIQLSRGTYALDVFCLDTTGAAVDGPTSAPLDVALLPLDVTPSRGPIGTRVSVTGGGCPLGSQTVYVRIGGAEDQVAFFDPEAPGQLTAPVAADGSFTLSFDVPSALEEGENSVHSFCTRQPTEGPPVPVAGPGFATFVVTGLPPTGGAPLRLLVAGCIVVLVASLLIVASLAPRFRPGARRSGRPIPS